MKKAGMLLLLGVATLAAASAALLLVMHGGTHAASAASRSASSAPIRLGMPVGLTGANSVVAPSVVQAAELAVDEINAAGGVLGRPLALVVVDDQSGAEGAKKAIAALGPQVDAILAMETSAARNAALPIVDRLQLPYIYTSFYEGHACSPWLHANGWVPEQQVRPVVQYLAEQKGARSFFLAGSDYAFGRGMLAYARKLIEAQGGQVVGEEYLPVDQADWSGVIAKMKAARPDALLSATAGGAPNVWLAKQLHAAGMKMPYGNLAIDEHTAKGIGGAATGMLMAASYFAGIESPENTRFQRHLLVKFGAGVLPPNELSVPQYEAVYLYKAAVERAGGTEAAKVLQALGTVSFQGPRGVVRMDQDHHAALSMRLGQVRSDGSVSVLKTYPDVPPGKQCPA
jgi:branched-chain amino acid transport system substrate-binding protein